MDAIEQAIRNAFAKGNPEDPAFRERVYRSAHAALEKALQANTALSPEVAERRRKGLMSAVSSIESEFIPAVEPVRPPSPASPPPPPPPEPRAEPPALEAGLEPPPVASSSRTERREPEFAADDRPDWPAAPEPVRRPVLSGDAPPPADLAPHGHVEDRRRALAPEPRRRSWGLIAGLLIFLIIIGLAVWTAAELSFLNLSSTQDTAQVDTPPATDNTGPRKPGEADALENWIIVFSPDDPTTVQALDGAKAEVVDGSGEKLMRINSGATGSPIQFDVGQGVLERIAGKRAVFDIVARTGDGPETQMSVACDFGALGDCGRNRYLVGPQRSEFLFEVDVPAGRPEGAGSITIVSDVENGGKALEIAQVRVSITGQ